MAALTTVHEALARVSELLEDTTPQFTRWTEAELVRWLNDAALAVAKYVPMACSRVDSIRLRPGTVQTLAAIPAAWVVPGDGSVPADVRGTQVLDILCLMGVDGLTPGPVLTRTEREILDTYSPAWHASTGTPEHWIALEHAPREFLVCPGVSPSGATWARVAYTATPARLVAGAAAGAAAVYGPMNPAVIPVADEFIDELVNYVCSRAHLKEAKHAEPAKAAHFSSLFTAGLQGYVSARRAASPNVTEVPGVTAAAA